MLLLRLDGIQRQHTAVIFNTEVEVGKARISGNLHIKGDALTRLCRAVALYGYHTGRGRKRTNGKRRDKQQAENY